MPPAAFTVTRVHKRDITTAAWHPTQLLDFVSKKPVGNFPNLNTLTLIVPVPDIVDNPAAGLQRLVLRFVHFRITPQINAPFTNRTRLAICFS